MKLLFIGGTEFVGRAMVSAAHSEDDLRFAVEKFAAVGKAMGIIK